jgi:hypothetical protein
MTKAPTVHNPTNFEPKDYEVLDYLDNHRPEYVGGSVDGWKHEVEWWEADMLRTFGVDWRKKVHHCAHCGNGMVRWITAVLHHPTGEVCVFGSDCTKRLEFEDKHAFKLAQLMAAAEARKVRFTVYNKRKSFLDANPALADAMVHVDDAVHAKNFFVKDVLAKLDRYGDLSEKQVAAVVASLARDVEWAVKRATEAAEPKGDAPSGRTEVTGTVLSMKEHENAFGFTMKMTLKLTNGARVWVTAPGSESLEKGDVVTLRATWTPSKDDKSFAFGSRPHLVRKVSSATATAAPAPAPAPATELDAAW